MRPEQEVRDAMQLLLKLGCREQAAALNWVLNPDGPSTPPQFVANDISHLVHPTRKPDDPQ